MPNIAKVLREEIARIARKEVKVAVRKVHRPTVTLRKDAAALKRRIATLERNARQLGTMLKKSAAQSPAQAESPEKVSKSRISGKGIKVLRRKLGVTQDDFARLAGVSGQAVYQWERKGGRLNLRNATVKAAIVGLKGIGAREAQKRLEEMKKGKKARRQRK